MLNEKVLVSLCFGLLLLPLLPGLLVPPLFELSPSLFGFVCDDPCGCCCDDVSGRFCTPKVTPAAALPADKDKEPPSSEPWLFFAFGWSLPEDDGGGLLLLSPPAPVVKP